MDQAVKFEEKIVHCRLVLFFDCSEEEMLKRLLKRGESSGRVDDNAESIKKRFETFRETSYPVVEYFEKMDKVRRISCIESPDQVYVNTRAAILETLDLKK